MSWKGCCRTRKGIHGKKKDLQLILNDSEFSASTMKLAKVQAVNSCVLATLKMNVNNTK
jgi:hypothetical protein